MAGLGNEKEYQPLVVDVTQEVMSTVFKLLKFYIMMLMVVWVAAMVSAMMNAGVMMGRKMGMHRMKGMWQERMGHMKEKAREELEKEESSMP